MSKINEYLENNCNKFPEHVGIVYRENNQYKELTNRELKKYVNSVVSYLKEYKNKKVAIIGSNKLEWLISFLAVFGYIGDAILIDKEIDDEQLKCIFNKVKPDLIIIDDEISLRLDTYPVVTFSDISKNMTNKSESCLNNNGKGNLYLHTSGTTGEPKVIKLNENNVFSSIKELNDKWEVTEKDACLFIIPLYHVYALISMFHALYAGCSIILEYDYKNLTKVLHETKPTLFLGVPLMYNKIKDTILSHNEKVIRALIVFSNLCLKLKIDIRKKIFKKVHNYFGGRYFFGCSAGSLLSYDTSKFFNNIGLPVYNVYGMTETSGAIAMNYKRNNKYDSVGKILDFNSVKIYNKDDDGVGEIWVKGPNVFDGYIDDKQEYLKDGFFDTGDVGYVKDDFLYVIGRKKNILIGDNGKNISPEELNKKILEFKGINDCNVIMKNNYLTAIVNTELSKNELKGIIDKVNSKLPKYKRISNFEITNKNIK